MIETLIKRARNGLSYSSPEEMADIFIREGIDPATAINAVAAGKVLLKIQEREASE